MTTTIKLGERELIIQPLTLGQIRRIGVGASKFRRPTDDPSVREDNWFDGTFDIVAAATGLPRSEIEAIPGSTTDELLAANDAILKQSGLVKEKPKDAPPKGEAPAETPKT